VRLNGRQQSLIRSQITIAIRRVKL